MLPAPQHRLSPGAWTRTTPTRWETHTTSGDEIAVEFDPGTGRWRWTLYTPTPTSNAFAETAGGDAPTCHAAQTAAVTAIHQHHATRRGDETRLAVRHRQVLLDGVAWLHTGRHLDTTFAAAHGLNHAEMAAIIDAAAVGLQLYHDAVAALGSTDPAVRLRVAGWFTDAVLAVAQTTGANSAESTASAPVAGGR